MMNSLDPFVVTTKEKLRFEQQFNALNPQNGIVTGVQAKGFLLKSGLSPLLLGQIWALADTDADGKMNLIEFSIACKLISLRLRNVEVPKQLPPTLIASLTHIGTPIRTPTGSLSPVEHYKSIIPPTVMAPQPQPVAMQPILIHNGGQPTLIASVQPTMIQQQPPANISPMTQQFIPTGTVLPQPASIVPNIIPSAAVAPTPLISSIDQLSNSSLLDLQQMVPQQVVPVQTVGPLPAPPTPPSGQASRSMSIAEKAPSIESPGSMEWIIKGPTKLKYTQLFNATDKSRNGFLTGPQARGILIQSKLPQAALAQIWGLSDLDSDGRLGCEEFVLAMYLCDQAIQGEKVPTVLPPDLVPPSFRKVSSRHGSIASSRHGSVDGAPSAADMDLLAQNSFEDKRKENYDKGQAELERRRKVLADLQKKEQDERERKERDEADKREKARLEAELKKQQEIEKELQRQREIEEERAEQRTRELEKKELARKEMEKQRQNEWESQKMQDLEQERQREQDRLLKLKGQNQTLTIELGTLNGKVKELSQKICDTRVGVTNVKSVIDGMRTTRDTQMSEMTQLKSRIKEQNQRLVQLSQEKVKLDAKSKNSDPSADSAVVFSNKQIIIKQLRDKLENMKSDVENKNSDITGNKEQLDVIRAQFANLLSTCEEVYNDYDVKRIQVLELKNNRKNETFSTAWDTAPAWNPPVVDPEPMVECKNSTEQIVTPTGYVKYRAIYEFDARNSDEISFQPGDTVMVPLEQNAEPGWIAGLINGHTGWFPETYVEKVESSSEANYDKPVVENRKLEGIEEVYEPTPVAASVPVPEPIEEIEDNTPTYNGESGEMYVACYPYQSAEAGDLVFEAGELVRVVKKEGDWWTGVIGSRTGIFPNNYVQTIVETASQLPAEAPNGSYQTSETEDVMQNAMLEDARNQAEADSEVSQINTQPTTDPSTQDYQQDLRSMTTSATPSLRNSKKGEVAQVIAPYEATSTEQLSLTRGQLIMIRKKTDSGWWEGEIYAKGRRRQVGWFPATYVKLLQGGRNSGRNTPLSASKVDLHETILDKVIALYPYVAINDDELSFDKDDIISVVGRDEPEWWRGELNGISGLFPSNYVGPFVTSGKNNDSKK